MSPIRAAAAAFALILVASSCGEGEQAAPPDTTAAPTTTLVEPATADQSEVEDEHEHEDDRDDDHGGAHGENEGEADVEAPVGATEVEEAAPRLIVADGVEPSLQVLDLISEEVLATFALPGVGRVEAVGRHVLVAARDADRLEVVDAGTWEMPHGDHSHFYVTDPTLTELGFDADDPTHIVDHHGLVALFNDGDGSVVVIDSHELGDDAAVVATVDSGAPHHGVAVAVEDLGVVIVSTPVEGEALPDGVAVHDLETGKEVERFGNCPELHGEVSTHDVVAFGCADGVLVLEWHDDHWDARKIDRPSDATGDARTGTLAAGHSFAFLVGNLGPEALVRVDLDAGTATMLPLPGSMVSFAVDPAEEVVLVVTVDGSVHRIDPVSGEVLQSLPVLDAFEPAAGHGGPPVPALTVAGDRAYLTDPVGGRVIELGIVGELRVAREFAVGGTPASVTVAGVGSGHAH